MTSHFVWERSLPESGPWARIFKDPAVQREVFDFVDILFENTAMAILYRFFIAISLFFFSSVATAFVSPVGISLVPPLQFPPADFSIMGVRASVLWGHHRDLYGLDIAAVGNRTDQDFIGLGLSGIFNWTEGETKILFLQGAGLINVNSKKAKIYGVQLAGGANYNSGDSATVGLQLAVANLSEHGRIYGFQVGAYNRAHTVYGFQIGLINYADNLHGLQIGLLNFHHKGAVRVSPILNAGF